MKTAIVPKLTTQQVESGKFSYFAAAHLMSSSNIDTASLSDIVRKNRETNNVHHLPLRDLRVYAYIECQEYPLSPYHHTIVQSACTIKEGYLKPLWCCSRNKKKIEHAGQPDEGKKGFTMAPVLPPSSLRRIAPIGKGEPCLFSFRWSVLFTEVGLEVVDPVEVQVCLSTVMMTIRQKR